MPNGWKKNKYGSKKEQYGGGGGKHRTKYSKRYRQKWKAAFVPQTLYRSWNGTRRVVTRHASQLSARLGAEREILTKGASHFPTDTGGMLEIASSATSTAYKRRRARQVGLFVVQIIEFLLGLDPFYNSTYFLDTKYRCTGVRPNLSVLVEPHSDGKHVTIRFTDVAAAYVLSTNDILSQRIEVGETNIIFPSQIFRDDKEFVLLASATCKSCTTRERCSSSSSSRRYRGALYYASDDLKGSKEFVTTLLTQHLTSRRTQRDEWSSASRILRSDRQYALGLVLRHGCHPKAIIGGAVREIRAFLRKMIAMVLLGLCAQRSCKSHRTSSGGWNSSPGIWLVWCAVARALPEFVG